MGRLRQTDTGSTQPVTFLTYFSKFALFVFDPIEVRRHRRDDAAETRWRVAVMILF
jgi:hypothetical protein